MCVCMYVKYSGLKLRLPNIVHIIAMSFMKNLQILFVVRVRRRKKPDITSLATALLLRVQDILLNILCILKISVTLDYLRLFYSLKVSLKRLLFAAGLIRDVHWTSAGDGMN